MALISIHNVSHSFGGPKLLENAEFQLERGERVCLVGRNGEGKTTFLNIIMRLIAPDSGTVAYEKDCSVSCLPQKLPENMQGTVYEVVTAGLGAIVDTLKTYADLSSKSHNDAKALARLDEIQQTIDSQNGWNIQQQVYTILSKMKLDEHAQYESLSVGMKRRVLLAQALVSNPDVIVLDEPTNHLDIEMIQWLEKFIASSSLTVLFVTHDRMFLKSIATRIIELDRGTLHNWNCNYDTFCERKDALLNSELEQNIKFDKKLSEEEKWLRKGIRARRTRNEGRVRELMQMRELRKQRRERIDMNDLTIQFSQKSGELVSEIKNISFKYDDNYVVKDFSAIVMRGDKIGIIGANGCGKTTLLKLLLGELSPESGSIRLGTKLNISYFDQLRNVLNDKDSIKDAVADGNEFVGGEGSKRHVVGYLKDFLFSAEQMNSPVISLSGGERNRLLLAKLFAKPSNVLVLDEPTNDLDAETLDLLEEKLGEYPGTVLVVSHDRAFLDNVVVSTIAYEGSGHFKEYYGGYSFVVKQLENKIETEQTAASSAAKKAAEIKPKKEQKKLSFKENKELESLPELIEKIEHELKSAQMSLSDPAVYSSPERAKEVSSSIEQYESKLAEYYERWELLEEKRAQFEQ